MDATLTVSSNVLDRDVLEKVYAKLQGAHAPDIEHR